MGLLSFHGRASSNCAASEMIPASSFWRPTICSPIGRPAFENPFGNENAGWPVALKGNVNTSHAKSSCNPSLRTRRQRAEAHRRPRQRRRDQRVVRRQRLHDLARDVVHLRDRIDVVGGLHVVALLPCLTHHGIHQLDILDRHRGDAGRDDHAEPRPISRAAGSSFTCSTVCPISWKALSAPIQSRPSPRDQPFRPSSPGLPRGATFSDAC